MDMVNGCDGEGRESSMDGPSVEEFPVVDAVPKSQLFGFGQINHMHIVRYIQALEHLIVLRNGQPRATRLFLLILADHRYVGIPGNGEVNDHGYQTLYGLELGCAAFQLFGSRIVEQIRQIIRVTGAAHLAATGDNSHDIEVLRVEIESVQECWGQWGVVSTREQSPMNAMPEIFVREKLEN